MLKIPNNRLKINKIAKILTLRKAGTNFSATNSHACPCEKFWKGPSQGLNRIYPSICKLLRDQAVGSFSDAFPRTQEPINSPPTCWGTHPMSSKCILSYLYKYQYLRQFCCSSNKFPQSLSPSHTQAFGIQNPDEHLNWSGAHVLAAWKKQICINNCYRILFWLKQEWNLLHGVFLKSWIQI